MILLVDDDLPIRGLMKRGLEVQGYHVLEASDGDEALRVAADYRGSINLLVTDVVMPALDGFTLVERLPESHPETRVLFISGQADRSVGVRGGLKESGQAFLLKPFTQARLLGAIRKRLGT